MKITKKLRDITSEELANYCIGKTCPECFLKDVRCCANSDTCWVYHKDLYSDKFLDQTIEVREILDKKEKEYLSAIIKPFRNKVNYIKKVDYLIPLKRKFIRIGYDENNTTQFIDFPDLPNYGMYKGMKDNRPYELEELGL